MIFNNYNIRKYVHKFLRNEMTLKDWKHVGGNLSNWFSDNDHKVTSLAYLFSDRVFMLSSMNRSEFHYVTDTYTYYYESEDTSNGDKYIPNDVFVICHNDATYEKTLKFIKRSKKDPSSKISIVQQDTSKFNENISEWKTTNILSMDGMFYNASSFNQSLNKWDTSNVISMKNMFRNAITFNNEIMGWNTRNVLNMESMFNGCTKFDMDISLWDVSNVLSVKYMFRNATNFLQEIRHWDLKKMNSSNIIELSHDIFDGSTCMHKKYIDQNGFSTNPTVSFWKAWPIVLCSDSDAPPETLIQNAVNLYLNEETRETAITTYGKICNWNVSNVTIMTALFSGHRNFNEDLSCWDVSNVMNMKFMFRNCKMFNSDISSWNTEKCTDMKGMFEGAEEFNRDISGWSVELLNNTESMFKRAIHFSYCLRSWNIRGKCTTSNMFANATNYQMIFDKLLSKGGTPYSDHFNYNASNKSLIRICVLPGANLVGFSQPGTIEVENDVTMCNYNEISTEYINKNGNLSLEKNALFPLLSSIKCNLAPGVYNNLPIVSNIAKGRYGKVSLSVTNYNNIEEIVVTEGGKDYIYNDTWDILLHSVNHKLINKKITTIQLSSKSHKITELDASSMINGKKKYEIQSSNVSVWVHVPEGHTTRYLYYKYYGTISKNTRLQLKRGKNNVGFTNSGFMSVVTDKRSNYKIRALNNDKTHNTFILNADNFINNGLEYNSYTSLIGDIGKVYGNMEGNVTNVALLTRSGNGKGAIVELNVKGNILSSMDVIDIGHMYKVGDALEIKHGIKYMTVLSTNEEIDTGTIHISKIRDKMNSDFKKLNRDSDVQFSPGTYVDVPVYVRKYDGFLHQQLPTSNRCCDKEKITCGSKAESCTFVIHLNMVVTDSEIKSISVANYNNVEGYDMTSLSVGDTISINHGIFKSFFLSHKSIFQSCKGLNPSKNNFLKQIAENKDNIRYPEGIYKNIEIVTLSGSGKGATIHIDIGSNNKINSVDLACIGFGYSINDTLSLPVFKLLKNDVPQSNTTTNIARCLEIHQDTHVVDEYSNVKYVNKEEGFKHYIEAPNKGYIIECVNDNTIVYFESTERRMFKSMDNNNDNSQHISTSERNNMKITSITEGQGSFSFEMQGPPVYTSCLLIGGGGSGGNIKFDSLHRGSNGGSAGSVSTGSLTLHEGEVYKVDVGKGGNPQLLPENSVFENGTNTYIQVTNIEKQKYLNKYPSFQNDAYDDKDNYTIIAIGGISGNNEETYITQNNHEKVLGGNSWRFDRNKRSSVLEEQDVYVGGTGGGGVISVGLLGQNSSSNRLSKKGRGGDGGSGMYWEKTGLTYGSGGSGCPNWGKPWQSITEAVMIAEKSNYNDNINNIIETEKQLLINRSYKLKNAENSVEYNEIERMYDAEIANTKSELMTKLVDVSLYIHGAVPCLPYFSKQMIGGGGGAISDTLGYTDGSPNTGSGGCAGYWIYGTCYPDSDEIIPASVLKPGCGGSGVVTFVYE